MKPIWIVEKFVGENGHEELIDEIRNQGMICHTLDVRNHFKLPDNLRLKVEGVYLFHGSIQMYRKLIRELVVRPIGWMTDENYLCSTYYPKFQKYLFNDWHMFTSVAGLLHNKWNIYKTFGKDTMIYVRPDGGDKRFSGQLIDIQDVDRIFKYRVKSNVEDDDIVVVSTPKSILGEWRFICSDKGEIIAVSSYMYRGNRTYIPSAPDKATKLCKDILNVGWFPDPVFTVDICEDNDNNYWLMEFNSFTSARTYVADKSKIVSKVSELAMERYNK